MLILQKLSEKLESRWLFSADGAAGGGAAPSGASGGSSPAPSGPGSSSSTPATPSTPSATPSAPSPSPAGGGPLKTPPKNVASTTKEALDEPDYDVFFGGSPRAPTPDGRPPSPVEVLTAPPGSQPPAAPQSVVEAVVPPQVPVEPQPTAPVATPPVAGQETAPQAPQQPQLDHGDPMVLASEMRRLEPEMMQHVAQNVFALSPEEVEKINQGDPASIVPTLMARAFIKSQQNTLELMGRLLPQMLQKHAEQTRRHSANEEKFYSRWKQIDKSKHGDLVMKYAGVYRQMHPQASLEQMVEDLGPMIMMAARIVPGATPPNGNNGAAVVPPTPAPGFVPALGGPAGVATAVEANPWDVLAPRG